MPITLKKAIELLTDETSSPRYTYDPDLRVSMMLGVEAMKKWKLLREGRLGPIDPLLPGEEHEPPCPN